ncbi:Bug family tripartite tricarboxylate transporter substrate binding protein [Roseococcus sp. YIM B11640]|uniref:Bug family tripartite tricarboxylate transporter substrate binding protein n=1 Tax=Roseococcus sp. YIM B11640 TaxID=3133973 RepID=UPI003C7C1D0D
MTTRRHILAAGLFAPAIATTASAQANWPDKPVRMVVPWPPGGSTDVLARLAAEQLQIKLGQPFVIENRPGAGGNIGADAIAKSAPDGYTMGPLTLGVWSIANYLYSRLPFDWDKDFQPISMHWQLPNVVVAPTQFVPATNLREFVEWSKARRQGVSFGSPGVGTTAQLCGALFCNRLGIDGQHVPFRGAAQIIPAMLSGDLTFAIDNLASYVPVVQEGRMRAFAVTGAERHPALPDVPTMAEAGVPDFVVNSWCAMAFPAGVPRPIVEKASQAMQAIANDPEVKARFLRTGAIALGSEPNGVWERAHRERPQWQEMVRIAGARLD